MKQYEVTCKEHGEIIYTDDRDEVDNIIQRDHKKCRITMIETRRGFRPKKTLLDLSKNYGVGGNG